MLKSVADTHAVIWYFRDDPRLSPAAKAIFIAAATEGNEIGISSITFAEIVYLMEKGRIPANTFADLLTELDDPNPILKEIPFQRKIAETMPQIDRTKVPDLPDRIIAATALQASVPLISRDRKIQLSGLNTIW